MDINNSIVITIEDLESYRGLSSELEALQELRTWLYYPVSSPNGREQVGQRGNTPSDPTRQAFDKLQAMDERISAKREEVANRLEKILDWLDTLDDSELRSMIYWRYIMGLDWSRVCLKVYGYRSSHACRKRVMRYFGREK